MRKQNLSKLIAFYNSLDARQKDRFGRLRERHGRD